MKILIISHYYKHKNAMASMRAIKLSKYFDSMGYDVTVLTAMQRDHWCKQSLDPIPSKTIIEHYAAEANSIKMLYWLYDRIKDRGNKRIERATVKDMYTEEALTKDTTTGRPKRIQKKKAFLSWLFYFSCEWLENHILYKSLVKKAKEVKLEKFDVVIATYPGAGAHQAGIWMKKHHRCKRLIADYRDPAYNPGARSHNWEIRHDKKLQDRTIKAADRVVCVSNGMAAALKEQYEDGTLPPTYVVHNGYDPDDYLTDERISFDHNTIKFVYTGTLYHGRRTVEMLTQVLQKLIDAGEITADRIALEYAGPDYPELLSQLKERGLAGIARDHGLVSHSMSLAMQKEADAVLLLNWNDRNYRGVIPGKIYEYMASGTPIIALIMGNEGDSESARMIRQAELGVACEKAVLNDMDELERYVRKLTRAHKEGRPIRTSLERVKQFDYRTLAAIYAGIIQF